MSIIHDTATRDVPCDDWPSPQMVDAAVGRSFDRGSREWLYAEQALVDAFTAATLVANTVYCASFNDIATLDDDGTCRSGDSAAEPCVGPHHVLIVGPTTRHHDE